MREGQRNAGAPSRLGLEGAHESNLELLRMGLGTDVLVARVESVCRPEAELLGNAIAEGVITKDDIRNSCTHVLGILSLAYLLSSGSIERLSGEFRNRGACRNEREAFQAALDNAVYRHVADNYIAKWNQLPANVRELVESTHPESSLAKLVLAVNLELQVQPGGDTLSNFGAAMALFDPQEYRIVMRSLISRALESGERFSPPEE